jgi:Eukaryotic DNA topoisomerase I, catalytic core
VDDLKPNTIEFDFLGKDSVQYTKEVEVAAAVYHNIGKWTRKTVYGKRELLAVEQPAAGSVLHAVLYLLKLWLPITPSAFRALHVPGLD